MAVEFARVFGEAVALLTLVLLYLVAAWSYPLLPDLPGADIDGDAHVVIDLDQHVIWVDGRPFALDDRPIDIEFGNLDRITWTFMVPPDAEAGEIVVGITPPGEPAPTIPVVVIRPTDPDPN